MFRMFTQLFNTFTVLFSAMEKFAKSLDHIGTSTEELALSYADEQRIKRQARLNQLMTETKVTAKQLKAVAE
jgi:hypothetical protein